jgi:hypothetical protein
LLLLPALSALTALLATLTRLLSVLLAALAATALLSTLTALLATLVLLLLTILILLVRHFVNTPWFSTRQKTMRNGFARFLLALSFYLTEPRAMFALGHSRSSNSGFRELRVCVGRWLRGAEMEIERMKLTTLAILTIVAFPLAANADSSQPNSAPGLQGKPVTTQGEGTTGVGEPRSSRGVRGGAIGTTDAGKTGGAGTRGAADSSIPGATNPNEPVGTRRR